MPPLFAPDSWIGQSIGEGRYLLQRRLGGGSMGDVFMALDTRIGQIVAVKILKNHWAETEDLRRRFKYEVKVCAALRSEHIVQISDYGVTPSGYSYYVMEYLRGQTLGDLMRPPQKLPVRLPVKQAINFAIQTCNGLDRAHTGVELPNEGEMIKVVHRDLKPDNIFIAETSIGALVKILDFGIAKIQNMQQESTSGTSTNMFMGTFHYASPEQIEVSKQLDGRSDIYSLGIILYEMLSGTNPFGLDTASGEVSQISWAVAHTSKPPIPLRSQPGCDRFSPELEAAVMRCLEKKPQDRFATVQELRQALQTALQTEAARNPAPDLEDAKPKPLVLPMLLGFLGAIGLSGLVLWLMLHKVPSSPSVDLPAIICNEPLPQALSGEPTREEENYKYYGTLVDNLFEGRGTVIDTRFRYDGEFKKGKKQGCGRLTYLSESIYREYVGQFQDDFPNGTGTLVFVNNSKYVGQVRTEKVGEGAKLYCQGKGVLILPNGERIEGTWEKGAHQESQGMYSCNQLPKP